MVNPLYSMVDDIDVTRFIVATYDVTFVYVA